ncbi:ribonuclease H2 subunit B-like [Teleopsis dalmanni]|uniref:ribonuclease H2 subunit B-like n=1 Tax=Teleopsis dalmanni TaxID=139649 RepID=UPI0018CD74AA|nr:ribonuclease H2 subunit B-like [Teleopsis dalmanni]
MSEIKSTRSSKSETKLNDSTKDNKTVKASSIRKVFYIAESLLENADNELRLERFFHPGKGTTALFITCSNKIIMEVLQFSEPRRSWLIDSNVCSNGRIYVTTPIDVTFLAIHHIRKHCTQRALELHCMQSEDLSTSRLLTTFVDKDTLGCVADVKRIAGSKTVFYKYNAEKTLAWLALKTRNIANVLKSKGIYCGLSAVSHNYTPSENSTAEDLINDIDYLRMACDIVGGYIDLDLHDELTKYFEIQPEIKAIVEEQKQANKRKSLQSLNSNDNKKIKLENTNDTSASGKLKNSSLLDDSLDDDKSNIIVNDVPKAPAPKERVLTAKEKALAKSAKGTKSISSFFKK